MGSLDSVLACAPLVTHMLCTLIHILLAVLALVHDFVAVQGPAGQGQSYPGNESTIATGSLPRCLPWTILAQIPRPWPCTRCGPPAFWTLHSEENFCGHQCPQKARLVSTPKCFFFDILIDFNYLNLVNPVSCRDWLAFGTLPQQRDLCSFLFLRKASGLFHDRLRKRKSANHDKPRIRSLI